MKLVEKCPLILLGKYLCHTLQGFLTCCKTCNMGLTAFPLKKIVLQIFIALKNLSFSARFEPVNLGSDGKYDNH
jgi:hypothetical protein